MVYINRYEAQQFVAPEGAEVSGQILLAYLNNLATHVTKPILDKYGFEKDSLYADKWYPNQMFLDIEKTIYQQPDGASALVAIGKSAAENYIPPAGVTDLAGAIEALPDVYTTNQRNLPDGYGWIVEKIGDTEYRFINNTGTTNHGAYGYVWAMTNKMKPDNAQVKVTPVSGFEKGATTPAELIISW